MTCEFFCQRDKSCDLVNQDDHHYSCAKLRANGECPVEDTEKEGLTDERARSDA